MTLQSLLLTLLLIVSTSTSCIAFSPNSKKELKVAVNACIKLSPVGDCSNSPHGPIGDWDVSAITDMSGMFQLAPAFNQDLSKWDVSAVTNMWGMFWSASVFNQDLSAWDVSAVTSMRGMIYDASSFNQKLSKWDVSAVTDMCYMFHGASFNQDLSAWDVSAVTDMAGMFFDASAFNQDLSAWDVSSVKNMDKMFELAKSFKQTLCGVAWVHSKATKVLMFENSHGSISSTVCTGGPLSHTDHNSPVVVKGRNLRSVHSDA